ncbi:hypothetical protein [Mesorhizobium sp. LNHC209A00]|uniref:hypothetical protein n=1 Tax=Mesorhizobium TaxID=68287 RepID=UPI00042601AF|nr:hypothetical protein [Mesorhizobium sp. LNHC209A00]
MNIVTTTPAAPRTASHLVAQSPAGRDKAQAVYQAGMLLLPFLEQGKPVTTALRTAMTTSFGGTDAQGFWTWKDVYEVLEAAHVLFLRHFGPAMLSRSTTPQATLAMMKRVADLLPAHTRRSDESQAMQQFSTPLPLAFVTAQAAAMACSDLVLEPSAGTGLLAVHAETARASLALNELAATRADLLGLLFPRVPVCRHDAAHIDDHLDAAIRPSVVLMNPPFTVGAYVDGHVATSTFHIVTGLLLPIWRRLPDDDCQVYRIQTDAGEPIIGRHIAPTLVATLLRNLGIDHVATLSADEAWAGLLEGRIGLQLADRLLLRRSRVMNDYRVELIGFTDAMIPRLKALGLISEIISWKLRLFIPTAAQGSVILAALFERHTLVGVTDRAAAA